MNHVMNPDQQEKRRKLKKMRFIATALLIIMALLYFIFRRYEGYNLFFSSVAAFAQAAMIGALADWFAVTALFRHPLGMSWIPHTAIIRRNRDKIGESLASFVVTNFFTGEIIENKLKSINFSDIISSYLKEKKEVLAEKTMEHLPGVITSILSRSGFTEAMAVEFKCSLRKIEPYPIVKTMLAVMISSQIHVSMARQLFNHLYLWIHDNRDKTLRIIEGVDRKLTLPFVGDMVYKYIDRTLLKLIEDMENGISTEFNREILHNLPEKLLHDFENSLEMKEKVEILKNQIVDSEQFGHFIDEKVANVKDAVLSYDFDSNAQIAGTVSRMIDFAVEDLLQDVTLRRSVDDLIKESISSMVCTNRREIGELISGTVKNWPLDDMVEKLEVQVGGDLQYIRINGTIIGGLAGLVIHIFTVLVK